MPSTILRPYLHTFVNRFRRSARGALGLNRDMLMLGVALLIMLCIFTATYVGLTAMARRPIFLTVLPPRLIDVAFFYFFFLLVVSNTVAATGNIFTSDRMSLLLVAPVSNFRMFAAKFIETCFETGLMFYVFTFPAILAISLRIDAPPQFLLSYFLFTLPYLIIPVALGIIFATLLSRIISFVWRRGAFFLVLLAGAILYGLSTLGATLERVRTEGRASQSLAAIAGLYENPNPYYMPSRWMSDILNTHLGAPMAASGIEMLTLLAAAAASIASAFLVYDFFMLRVRSAAGTHTRIEEERPELRDGEVDAARSIIERITNLVPADQQVRAIIVKDLTSLLRDRSQALQLLMFLGVATLYITVFNFMAYGMNLELAARQVWHAVLATLNAVFCGFIFTTVLTRLVYPSVSLEGRAFWILQVTPIEILKLIQAKLMCWLPITSILLITILWSGAAVLDLSAGYYLFIIVYGASVSVGCTGLAIGLGARFASFDWEAPNQITVSAGTLVLLLIGVAHVLTMTVPVAAINAMLIITPLRATLGQTTSFVLLCGLVFGIILFNIYIAKIACEGGARSLAESRGQDRL